MDNAHPKLMYTVVYSACSFFTNLDLSCIDNARIIYRKIRYNFECISNFSMCATCTAQLTPLDIIILIICSEEYKSLRSLLCNFLHLLALTLIYSHKASCLQTPSAYVLSETDRLSSTTIYSNI